MGELGTRYKCFKCETKFYDLGRPQPICPSCGEDQNNRETRQILKRKKKRSSSRVEPDIHLIPEDHDPLMAHVDHEHEEHDDLPGMSEEREGFGDHPEGYAMDKDVSEDDKEGYGSD